MSRRGSITRPALIGLTAVVAGVSFSLSFRGLTAYGEDLMHAGGMSPLVPLGVDAASLVAIVSAHMMESARWRARAYAWLVFGVTTVASIAGNLADGFARHLEPAGLVGVAAWPVIFAMVSHLALVSWRAHRADTEAPAEPVVSHAEPVAVTPRPRATLTVSDASEPASVTRQRPTQKRVTPRSLTAADRVMEAHLANPGATRAELATMAKVSESTVTRYRPKTAADASPSAARPAETLPVDGHADPLPDASETRVNGTRQTDLLDSLTTA